MGLFSSNRSIHKIMNERLAMEWRIMRNVYMNHLTGINPNSEDFSLITQIGAKCDEINQEVSKGYQSFSKSRSNKETIVGIMASIVLLDNQILDRPEKSNRTMRLIGITNSILLEKYEGYFQDSNGYHPDWYRGL